MTTKANPLNKSLFERHMRIIDQQKKDRAAAMPDDKAAIDVMFKAFLRLRDLGWNDARYCPKDGTPFEAIEPGSTGIHTCYYLGEWPTGAYFVEDAGDLWPSKPILFRLKPIAHPVEGRPADGPDLPIIDGIVPGE